MCIAQLWNSPCLIQRKWRVIQKAKKFVWTFLFIFNSILYRLSFYFTLFPDILRRNFSFFLNRKRIDGISVRNFSDIQRAPPVAIYARIIGVLFEFPIHFHATPTSHRHKSLKLGYFSVSGSDTLSWSLFILFTVIPFDTSDGIKCGECSISRRINWKTTSPIKNKIILARI